MTRSTITPHRRAGSRPGDEVTAWPDYGITARRLRNNLTFLEPHNRCVNLFNSTINRDRSTFV
jgi:hypothetical protein